MIATERPFDWEERWSHDAIRVPSAQAHAFSTAISEGGLSPQYTDRSGPMTIFWWDRRLSEDLLDIGQKALDLCR